MVDFNGGFGVLDQGFENIASHIAEPNFPVSVSNPLVIIFIIIFAGQTASSSCRCWHFRGAIAAVVEEEDRGNGKKRNVRFTKRSRV